MSDWSAKGFQILNLTDATDTPRNPTTVKIGWSEKGLLLALEVFDSQISESKDSANLFLGDSVEVFLGRGIGFSGNHHLLISPGLSAEFPKPRWRFSRNNQLLDENDPGVSAEIARRPTPTGYTLEVMFPWKNLGISPALDTTVAFQVIVNNVDSSGNKERSVWFPLDNAYASTFSMYPLRLGETPDPAYEGRAFGRYWDLKTLVRVVAPASAANAPVELFEGGKKVASGTLAPVSGGSMCDLELPMPPVGSNHQKLEAVIANKGHLTVAIPKAEEWRAQKLQGQDLKFLPYAFTGNTFPTCRFDQALFVKALIGPYTLRTRFYDRDYKEVTQAGQPGRYGAITEIETADGTKFRRYSTLFRLPDETNLATWQPQDAPLLPPALAKNAPVDHGSELWGEQQRRMFQEGLKDQTFTANLLALWEGSPAPGNSEEAWNRELQWWVPLKRQLAGKPLAADSLQIPRPKKGLPAPVLKPGSPQEASFDPAVCEELRKFCRQWAQTSGQPFAVCLARNGVVFFHEAFGTRNGQAMTVENQSDLACITKMLGGTLTMMLVDRDILNLDEPISKFDPLLSGSATPSPLTLRHLFTHTAGLWGHWGDREVDLDERIRIAAPYLHVGEKKEYSSTGYEVAGKILEMNSGETVFEFFNRHLIGPLGIKGLTPTSKLGWAARATPLALATVCQMLLNEGSYGDMEFFDRTTFQKMLPQNLEPILHRPTDLSLGIGLMPMGGHGLSADTFGHTSFSDTICRIDPENKLVVVVTRDQGGENFAKNEEHFLKTVAKGLRPLSTSLTRN